MHSVGVYEVNGVSGESVWVVVSGYGLVARGGKGFVSVPFPIVNGSSVNVDGGLQVGGGCVNDPRRRPKAVVLHVGDVLQQFGISVAE